jgi:hypothetical protein
MKVKIDDLQELFGVDDFWKLPVSNVLTLITEYYLDESLVLDIGEKGRALINDLLRKVSEMREPHEIVPQVEWENLFLIHDVMMNEDICFKKIAKMLDD